MAREVDLGAALSVEDAHYVNQRPWLIAEAERQGVEDIRQRIAAVIAGEQDTAPELEEEDDEEFVDIEDLTVDQLREELEARELATSGKKADLVDRLKAAIDDEED